MNKLYFLKTMLLLCALVVGSSSVWAEDSETVTLNNATSVSGDDVTISFADGGNNSKPNVQTNGIRCYPRNNMTVSSTTKKISKIELAVQVNENKNGVVPSDVSVNTGTLTGLSSLSTSTTSGEWTAANEETSSVTFTVNGTAGNIHFITAKVYYVESSDPSSGATFTYTTPSIDFPATKTYSQAPTTADGYAGTISYAITANTAGATINASTGLVTVTCGGSVTVKATAPATTGFRKSEATYTLTVNDTRTSPGLAWSANSASVTYKELPYTLPSLTNTHNLSVLYSSSEETVATIDATGTLTIKNITGSTTISAEFEGNDDYLPQTVSYTLNVTKGAYEIIDGVFDFVQAGSSSPVVDYGSGVTQTSSSSTYVTDSKTWTAGNVTMVTAKVSGSGYRWWSADHTLRFYNKSSATFSVPSGYVIIKIVTTGANFDSASEGSLSSSTWTGALNEVTLYATGTRNIKTITITYTTATKTATVTTAGWKTYAPDHAVSFREGTKAYIITAATSSGATLTQVTSVPANTAVLLEGTKGSEVIHTMDVVASSNTVVSGNCLHISDGTAKDGIYVLADGDFGVGFYLWTGSSALSAGKIYMQIPSATRAFISLDADASGIDATLTDGEVLKNVYDLQGRRVAHPTKGLYIVNGKKVIKN